MSSRCERGKKGFIPGIFFAAFVFLMTTPAGCKESSGPIALRLSPPDITLLKRASIYSSQAPPLEPVTEYGSFFGLKITLRLQGGWNTFSGGDIKKGIDGMYDNGVAYLLDTGYPTIENARDSGRGGIEAGGDLIYAITPRFGIGIGMARTSAWKESHFLLDSGSFRSWPRVKVSALRAGLFYSLPFAGSLAVSFRGGPAFYSAEYNCVLAYSGGFLRDGLIHTSYSQDVSARQLGFEGGLGFEFNPNPFVAIFIEVQGRSAKIRNLEGDEAAVFFQDGLFRESAGSGPVYIVDTVLNPQLDIVTSGGAAPGGARLATLNFSGASFLVGLKFRL